MDPLPATPSPDDAAAPPQRKKFGLPPATPPIRTVHDNWTPQQLAYAICGGVKGVMGHADATNADAAHRAWMDVVKLLPTHVLAGLYNAAFSPEEGDEEEVGGFWQESALTAKLLNDG